MLPLGNVFRLAQRHPLKTKLARELKNAPTPRVQKVSEISTTSRVGRQSDLGLVENIKRLRPELKIHRLVNGKRLIYG
jgi:hypothetical protein